jgi:hypothetical protein
LQIWGDNLNMKRRAKTKSVKRRKEPKEMKEWNDTISDLNKYKLSDQESQQRKAALVSKHREIAREEWLKKQDEIKQGKLPKEIQELIAPPKKKYTSNSAYISKDPKNSNNRPTTSLSKPDPLLYAGAPSLKPSYTIIRTTHRPASASINPIQATETYARTYSSNIAYDSSAFTDLKSLDRLDSAMQQLESAMNKAIDYNPEYINRSYTHHEEDKSEISDSSIFTYSPEGSATPVRPASPYQPQFSSILEYKENSTPPQDYANSHFDAYTPEDKDAGYNPYLIEPKTNSKFDMSTLKGYTLENTFGKEEYDTDKYIGWLDRDQDRKQVEDESDMKFSNIYTKFLNNTSEYIQSTKSQEKSLPESDVTSSHADYLAQLLEQTRKDLEHMQVPSFPAFEVRSTDPRQDLLKEIPAELHENYSEDLIGASYRLRPIPKFSSGPVIRGKVPISSLALVDSVKRMPSFRSNM